MSSKQVVFLGLLILTTWGVVRWVSYQSNAPRNYRWFVHEIPKQQQTNQQLELQNRLLRSKTKALLYDYRSVAREVRDRLTLFKKGELVIHLPKP